MELPVADGAPDWTLSPEGNLGGPETVDGRRCRVLRTSGSIYHKAEWAVLLPPRARVVHADIQYRYDGAEPLEVRLFTHARKLLAGGDLLPAAAWSACALDAGQPGSRELDVLQQTNYGTGAVRITRVQFLDRDGREVVDVRHGQPFTVRAHLSVSPQFIQREVTMILAFARHESSYSAYVYEPRISLPPADECAVDVRLEAVQLGSGKWYVSMGFGEVGLYERDVIGYFTIDGAWYHMLAERLELRVTSETNVDTLGCFFTHPARVAVLGDTQLATAGERPQTA